MQIIYKVDILFIWIYSTIILIVGVIGAISIHSILFFLFSVIIELIYLFFSLKHPFKRAKAVKKQFPQDWKNYLSTFSLFYRNLDNNAKMRFERDIQIFLSDFSVGGVQRQEVDEEVKLLVASAIATLLHGRPFWEPPIQDGVVIYPGQRFDRHYQTGKGNIAGQASHKGPMILTEGALKESFSRPHDGYNVVIHELAHYFDLEDGRAEGIPAARLGLKKVIKWRTLISKEWNKTFQGQSFLNGYAGTNEAEFFAVATESFFEKPWELKTNNPELYSALKDFFNLDTAKIIKQS